MLYQIYDWQRAAHGALARVRPGRQRRSTAIPTAPFLPPRQPQRRRRVRPHDAAHAALRASARSASTRWRSAASDIRGARGLRPREALLPPAAFREGRRAEAAARAGVRAALGPLRHALPRYREDAAAPTTTSGSPTGWTRKEIPIAVGPVPFRRLRGVRARVPRLHGPRRARDLGLPAHGAGACRRLAHGGRGRSDPALAHDDGRADRLAPQPDRGEQLRHATGRCRGSRRR